jgi:predicted outer membrane protein
MPNAQHQLAQRMVTDHTQANQELMQLAKSKNLDLPTKWMPSIKPTWTGAA